MQINIKRIYNMIIRQLLYIYKTNIKTKVLNITYKYVVIQLLQYFVYNKLYLKNVINIKAHAVNKQMKFITVMKLFF
jgi:hypothetical protein